MKKFILPLLIFFYIASPWKPVAESQGLTAPSESRISKEDAYKALGKRIGNYSFIDQDGKPFELKEYLGKPFVITFIYTNCPVICPALLLRLEETAKAAGERLGRDFRILVVGFDVDNDTPDMLQSWGKNFTDNFEHWKFVTTGDWEKMNRFVDQFGFGYKKSKEGYDHLILTSVVGKDGTIMAHVFGDDYAPQEVLSALDLTAPRKPILSLFSTGGWTLLVSILIAFLIFSLALYFSVLAPLKKRKEDVR